jgi:hypothetical protein
MREFSPSTRMQIEAVGRCIERLPLARKGLRGSEMALEETILKTLLVRLEDAEKRETERK